MKSSNKILLWISAVLVFIPSLGLSALVGLGSSFLSSLFCDQPGASPADCLAMGLPFFYSSLKLMVLPASVILVGNLLAIYFSKKYTFLSHLMMVLPLLSLAFVYLCNFETKEVFEWFRGDLRLFITVLLSVSFLINLFVYISERRYAKNQ